MLVFLVPTHTLAGLCGATGIRLKPFLSALIPGQVPFTLMYYFAGGAVAGISEKVIAFLSEHLVVSTLVATALVVLQQFVSRLLRQRRAPVVADTRSDLETNRARKSARG